MDALNGFKDTEVGQIPKEWDIKSLRQVIDSLEAGVSVNSTDSTMAFDDTPSILKTSCVFGGKFIPSERKKIIPEEISRAKVNPQSGTIIFSRMNTPDLVGENGFVPKDFPFLFLPDRLWITKFRRNSGVNPLWLAYLLNTELFKKKIRESATGTSNSMKNIGKESLLNLKIPFPLEKEQIAISDTLGDLDQLIEDSEKLIAKKRDIKQATMQQLLTGKTRLPGFNRGSGKIKNSAVGEVASDWEIVSANDACIKIQDGTHFSPSQGGNQYLYLTSKNIRMGYLDLSNIQRISEAEHKKIYARCDVKFGDLLLTKDGANTGNAAINTIDEQVSLLSSVAFLRFKSDSYAPNYFLQQICSSTGQSRIQGLMSGNAITRLTLKKIRDLQFAVPTFHEQVAIAEVLADMDEQVNNLVIRQKKLKLLKQGMMQELLTGRIRLL